MNREQARRALEKLDKELRPKLDERERLMRELRRSLVHSSYEHREQFLHPVSRDQPTTRSQQERAALDDRCAICKAKFFPGEQVVEYLDDAGNVVERVHRYHTGRE